MDKKCEHCSEGKVGGVAGAISPYSGQCLMCREQVLIPLLQEGAKALRAQLADAIRERDEARKDNEELSHFLKSATLPEQVQAVYDACEKECIIKEAKITKLTAIVEELRGELGIAQRVIGYYAEGENWGFMNKTSKALINRSDCDNLTPFIERGGKRARAYLKRVAEIEKGEGG